MHLYVQYMHLSNHQTNASTQWTKQLLPLNEPNNYFHSTNQTITSTQWTKQLLPFNEPNNYFHSMNQTITSTAMNYTFKLFYTMEFILWPSDIVEISDSWILGPYWDHIGTILGLHIGTILGPYWDHIGTTYWGHIGTTYWDHIGTTYWDHIGTILEPHIGTILGPHIRTILGPHIGTTYWACVCILLGYLILLWQCKHQYQLAI